MKRGTMTSTEMFGLILGIAAVGVLLMLAGRLWSASSDTSKLEDSSKAYFETFMEEISKVDEGNVGEFTMWQVEEDKGKRDVFLIYFSDKYRFAIGDRTFVTYNNKNAICVCFWLGEESVCDKEHCTELDYPVKYNGEYGQWVISTGDQITINKGEEEYIVDRAGDGIYSGPTRLMDVEFGDIILDDEGNKFEVIASERKGNLWEITLESEEGVYEGIVDSATSLLKEYEGIGYEINNGDSN